MALVLKAAAVCALVSLAAVDQWRYRLAAPGADAASLSVARRLNPWDTPVHLGLATAGLRGGDRDLAERELRAAVARPSAPLASFAALQRLLIESNRPAEAYDVARATATRWPADVDTLVNAGVLASRLNRTGEAEHWWRRALQQDDSLRHVHLYLAERLDADGRGAEALAHYQRHLELLVADPAAAQRAPRDVALVALKFGDALARAGRPDDARSQFALADLIATRAGLADVAELVRARRQPGASE